MGGKAVNTVLKNPNRINANAVIPGPHPPHQRRSP